MIIHPHNIIAANYHGATCRLILRTDAPTGIGDLVINDGNQYRIHAVKETDNSACPWMHAGTYLEAKGKRQ